MADVGVLQQEALKRKERLKALRRKQRGENEEDDSEPPEKKSAEEDMEGDKSHPVFKNYKPQDDVLQEKVAERVKPGKVEEHIEEQLQAAKPEPVVEEVDLINLAPRKPDWDLKRDVSKKLEKLEKRTQRAIAELIRDRLAAGKEDLATIVNVNAAANQQTVDSDED